MHISFLKKDKQRTITSEHPESDVDLQVLILRNASS